MPRTAPRPLVGARPPTGGVNQGLNSCEQLLSALHGPLPSMPGSGTPKARCWHSKCTKRASCKGAFAKAQGHCPPGVSDPAKVKASLAAQSPGEGAVGCWRLLSWWGLGSTLGLAQKSTFGDGRCCSVPI